MKQQCSSGGCDVHSCSLPIGHPSISTPELRQQQQRQRRQQASKPGITLQHAPALIEAHSAAVSPSTSERVALHASTLASTAVNLSMALGKLAVLLSSPTPK
jgi:hypothetical protein